MTWKCTLCDSCMRYNSIQPVGQKHSPIMVVLRCPDYHENKANEALVGARGDFLKQQFANIGFTIESIYITYLTKCRMDIGETLYLRHRVNTCTTNYLIKELDRCKPKLVIIFDVTTLFRFGDMLGVKLDNFKPLQLCKSYMIFFMPDIDKFAYTKPEQYPKDKFSTFVQFYKKHINPTHLCKLMN